MTTINEINDLFRILEERPDWRKQLQTLLLTEELLDMPRRLTTLTATVETLAGTAHALLEIAEATNRRLDRLDDRTNDMHGDVREIHGITRRQHTDFQNFKAQFAEEVAMKNVPTITDLVGRSIGKDLEDIDTITNEQRREWVRENRDRLIAIGLTRDDFISFRQPNITIHGRNERDYRDTCYIAVEASYTCERNDVTRARRNARIIETCSNIKAYAVVAGIRINDDAAAMLADKDELPVVWFQIKEETLDI